MDPARVVLSLTGVTKTFPGVVALRDVTFAVLAGEIHALVGGNGAGKSTLMGVAAGSILPDTGSVEIGGVPMTNPTPLTAARLGLAIVRQDPALLPDLSVAENMWLGVRPQPQGRHRRGRRVGGPLPRAVERAHRPAAPASPTCRCIVASSSRSPRRSRPSPRCSSLTSPPSTSRRPRSSSSSASCATSRSAAGAVVYISHRIPEVLRIADRVTVLRDGQTRGTFERADVNESDVVKLIVGRAVEKVFPAKRSADA